MLYANRKAMELLRQINVTYHVTLPVGDFSERHLADLAQELAEIDPQSIKLLQIMPLGRNRDPFYDSNPAADRLINLLKLFGYNGMVKKNCAMCCRCNGFSEHKLGLDQNGNLYWCIWAAGLGILAEANPFYLGNLLEEPLMQILARNSNQAETIQRDTCHVLSYLRSSHSTRP